MADLVDLGVDAQLRVDQNAGEPVIAVATLADIIDYLRQQPGEHDKLAKIEKYRQQYGANL